MSIHESSKCAADTFVNLVSNIAESHVSVNTAFELAQRLGHHQGESLRRKLANGGIVKSMYSKSYHCSMLSASRGVVQVTQSQQQLDLSSSQPIIAEAKEQIGDPANKPLALQQSVVIASNQSLDTKSNKVIKNAVPNEQPKVSSTTTAKYGKVTAPAPATITSTTTSSTSEMISSVYNNVQVEIKPIPDATNVGSKLDANVKRKSATSMMDQILADSCIILEGPKKKKKTNNAAITSPTANNPKVNPVLSLPSPSSLTVINKLAIFLVGDQDKQSWGHLHGKKVAVLEKTSRGWFNLNCDIAPCPPSLPAKLVTTFDFDYKQSQLVIIRDEDATEQDKMLLQKLCALPRQLPNENYSSSQLLSLEEVLKHTKLSSSAQKKI